jgi:hypothetical protein
MTLFKFVQVAYAWRLFPHNHTFSKCNNNSSDEKRCFLPPISISNAAHAASNEPNIRFIVSRDTLFPSHALYVLEHLFSIGMTAAKRFSDTPTSAFVKWNRRVGIAKMSLPMTAV